jgi:hypothetical protein
MTLQERCQAAEAKLADISIALLDCRPETLERCEAGLHEIAGLLDLTLDPASRPAPSDREGLIRLRQRSQMLGFQAQHAANLCQGWAQLQLSEGYTDQGRPVLPPSTPLTSYEG